MSIDLGQFDREQQQSTWQIILKKVSTREFFAEAQIKVFELFTPLIAKRLAELFLMLHYHNQNGYDTFLTHEQLLDIASERMARGRDRLEADLDESPGIYVFVGLVNKNILKVGKADNLQKRIANGHLRYGNQKPDSNLIDYCKSTGIPWPDTLQIREITLLCFPMKGSSDKDRSIIEFALQELLIPEMS